MAVVLTGEDPIWWWVLRLVIVLMYFLLAIWKAYSWCRKYDVKERLQENWARFSGTQSFSTVVPSLSEDEDQDLSKRKSSYKMQLDGLESDIAYVSLTQVIAPFCLFTTVVSLGRNVDIGMGDMGLVYGDTNVIPLMATGFIWFRGIPPGRRMRISMWFLLALWFGVTMISHLLSHQWHFVEEVWLNHMVFVTMMSLALRVQRVLVVVNMLLHTIFFLSLTFIKGSETYGPSPGSQVLLVSLVVLCINYSQVLSQMVSKKANAEYNLVQAEVVRVNMEKRALDAEKEARAKLAEAEAKEAVAQAEVSEDRRLAAEANARFAEKMHDALQHLLLMLCDAVLELDSELRILDQGKLGLVLYQHQKDLAGRLFTDFLVQEDVQHFRDMVETSQKQNVPVSVTMMGSYSMKIRMTIYLTQIAQAGGSCTYVMGLCESSQEEMKRNSSQDFIAFLRQDSVNVFDSPTREVDYFSSASKDFGEPPILEKAMSDSTGSQCDLCAYPPIQPMVAEERMQSLLPLLWSWPVPEERLGCCETHRLIEEATELLQQLKRLQCQDAPRCLVWQCPS